SESASAPSCVHQEADLVLRILRDLFTGEVRRVVVDDDAALQRCREFVRAHTPSLEPRLERFEGAEPIFETFGIEKEIQRALRRRVWLPSGGYLVIHPTEALVAVDVNTGKFVGSTRFEETALITNLEAAREVVRQIRLRDLGGILVIDFIDLMEEKNRVTLAQALQRELESDRARSRVLQISEFGLVEITRQRIRQGIESVLCGPCPECRGSGRLRNPPTLRFQIQRELKKSVTLAPEARWVVRAHPSVVEEIERNRPSFLEALGAGREGEVRVDAVPTFHVEEFEILTG
ncbi:MAG TPA: ribonuclease E/G, partial [Candidatus Polarisedimenticolia bacterium]|nr:ribonuclease E/G [Candidatus Polarisedimenticolia bacterium]